MRTPRSRRVLVLEGPGARGAVAAVRSLARAGWEVGVGRPPMATMAGRSRAVRHIHVLPDLAAGADAYLDAVTEVAGRYDFVVGAGDAEVLAVADGSDRIGVAVAHPPRRALLAAMDKLRLHRAAVTAGVASPDTAIPDEQASWAKTETVVVKPRLHWEPNRLATELRVEARAATGPVAVEAEVRRISDAGAEPVLQRYLTGQLMAYVAVIDVNGRILAHAQQRALHTYPKRVGVSARAVTEPVDLALAARVVTLVGELGLSGLIECQFLRDATDTAYVIDINARFYGSLQLAVAAGADLPALWLAMLTGTVPSGPPSQGAPGVRYQWLEGDLRRAGPTGALSVLAYGARAHHSVWSPTDPGPSVAYLGNLARRSTRLWRRANPGVEAAG
jgi:predicted ATP-grasp superfamily ATP-dependent carboligase